MCSPADGTRGALLPSPSLHGVREFSERPHDYLRGRTERVEEATGAVYLRGAHPGCLRPDIVERVRGDEPHLLYRPL